MALSVSERQQRYRARHRSAPPRPRGRPRKAPGEAVPAAERQARSRERQRLAAAQEEALRLADAAYAALGPEPGAQEPQEDREWWGSAVSDLEVWLMTAPSKAAGRRGDPRRNVAEEAAREEFSAEQHDLQAWATVDPVGAPSKLRLPEERHLGPDYVPAPVAFGPDAQPVDPDNVRLAKRKERGSVKQSKAEEARHQHRDVGQELRIYQAKLRTAKDPEAAEKLALSPNERSLLARLSRQYTKETEMSLRREEGVDRRLGLSVERVES